MSIFSPRRPIKRAVWTLGGVAAVIVLCVGGYLGALQLTGNFSEVVAGELYRSAQPSAMQMASYEKNYGIRTIINLRGENTGKPWYDAEVAEAARLGITHIDFRMSAKRELTQAQAADLVAILAKARKPLLVHCEGGADRSGLASALYLAAISKHSETSAEGQMSIRYGHISLPLSAGYAMDQTFEALEPWLGFTDS